ncbi:nucleolar MIF4G domain-containing protein 1 homolog [Diorhabda carinulata]|uniref:nucleolar MIF4G domain-containing protein 1 homolog n=1 Tax=Diorhabda carinulata TaxID=1163345 RepID=UPI00259FE896|nr:nucleolar MIF4G domain-containing protein 1 homolog [Diorhabda carinulata]
MVAIKKKSDPFKSTRKQQRKEKRKEKKSRRNTFFSKKKLQIKANVENTEINIDTKNRRKPKVDKKDTMIDNSNSNNNKELSIEQIRKKEKNQQKQLEAEMKKQRKKQLLEANKEEDKIIVQMEKQLGLKKRKSKNIPKGFTEDGLDYLLEVIDPEYLKHGVTTEQGFEDADNDFEEDFALMTNKKTTTKKSTKSKDISGFHETEEESEEETVNDQNEWEESSLDESTIEESDDSIEDSINTSKFKRKIKENNEIASKKKKLMSENDTDDSNIEELEDTTEFDNSTNNSDNDNVYMESEVENEEKDDREVDIIENKKGAVKQFLDGTWEDIYGRLRAKDGTVITKKTESKYVPPALREKKIGEGDEKRIEKLNRLRKQLKGLLNRLAESNMHNIASQIEQLYMENSRNDMNDTLTNLIMESLVSEVITPERLLIEHIVLVMVLHANVGTEVGAHFLQRVIKKFDESFRRDDEVENKTLDNIICIISQLYNFKLFDSKLMYEILGKLSSEIKEKRVECILHVLRSVGFNLRKDNPLALKSLIIDLQAKASIVSKDEKDNLRIKFMLDILLAIKNNNVNKIPNYDVSYPEHLKKLLKGFIRKGNYATELNMTLEDLLKADERGKWWVVGSAWTGGVNTDEEKSQSSIKTEGFSSKLLELAKKQRMNTDVRRNVFCILMSAEDYMDAFEKLLKLGLKNTQEREIINVLLHCCLQEKQYNPYYGHLAQKFCDYNRKYQLAIKYSMWDKIKAMDEHSGTQLSNLAKLLIHLFIEKGLPISILKIMQFAELDKLTLRFTRQILLGILLHDDLEECLLVFSRVAQSDKLKMFRESLRLFIHHFLLRNLKNDQIADNDKNLLEKRAKMVEKVLTSKEVKIC